LIYDAGTGRYTMRGRPHWLRVKKADGTCDVTEAAVVHFDRTSKAPEWDAAENPGDILTRNVPCTEAAAP
jgi:hypothetical protein